MENEQQVLIIALLQQNPELILKAFLPLFLVSNPPAEGWGKAEGGKFVKTEWLER